MNCWFWIILLWCFCGNGSNRGNCTCSCNCERDKDSDCRETVFPTPCAPQGCGCGNDMGQPRGFAGFGDNNTCGCEEKENQK